MDKSKLPPMGKRSTPLDVVKRMVDRKFSTSGGVIRKRKPAPAPVSGQPGVSGYMKRKKKTLREIDNATK